MIVCIGLGLSRYKQLDGQDDQINCLSILSIFVETKDLFEHLEHLDQAKGLI